MMVSAHISNDDQFSLKTLLFQVTSSLNRAWEARVSKKKHKVKVVEENQRQSSLNDLIYNPSSRKLFLDFFTNLIKQESTKILANASREDAIIYCEVLENTIVGKFDEMKDVASHAEFETLEDFYAYASAVELVNTIESFYIDMKEISLTREDEKFEAFLSKKIEKSLEKNPRARVHDTKSFLASL